MNIIQKIIEIADEMREKDGKAPYGGITSYDSAAIIQYLEERDGKQYEYYKILNEYTDKYWKETVSEKCGVVYDPRFPKAAIPAGDITSTLDKVCQNPKGSCPLHDKPKCEKGWCRCSFEDDDNCQCNCHKPPQEKEEFMECDTCSSKSGSPELCQGCLHNRAVISRLYNEAVKEERARLKKIYLTKNQHTFLQELE